MGATMNQSRIPVEPKWRLMVVDAGLPTDEILRRAGLPDDLLSRKGATVSVGEYYRFWSAVTDMAPSPDKVVAMASKPPIGAFSPGLFAAQCSPNLEAALKRLAEFKLLCGPLQLSVERRPEWLEVELQYLQGDHPVPPLLVSGELVFLVGFVREATRHHHLCPIQLECSTDLSSPAFVQYFGVAPLRSDRNALRFSSKDARRPFLTANEELWSLFEPELRVRLAKLEANEDVATRVRAVLLESLPAGRSTLESVASRMGVGGRSIQRQLALDGTSYQNVLRQVREELARHYLERTNVSMAEISYLLGFSDPNSFNRAFRKWTHSTPNKHRERVRSAGE